MATSVRSDDGDLVTIEVRVAGRAIADTILVEAIEVEQAINQIPSATLTIVDGNAAQADFPVSADGPFAPGAEIEIRAGYHAKNQTIFKGVIVRHGLKIGGDGQTLLVIGCQDKAARTLHNRVSAVFRDMTDSQAIERLLADAGLDADVQATSIQHEQLVLNRASVWDFLRCRAEANGQVVRVADGKVTVGAPAFHAAELGAEFGDSIVELDLEVDASRQWPGVSAKAWDPATQAVERADASEPVVNVQGDWRGEKLADALAPGAVELVSPSVSEEGELKSWADAALLRSRLARIRGRVRCPGNAGLAAGNLLDLKGLGRHFNGAGYISAVRHHLSAGVWLSEAEIGLPAAGLAETHALVSAPSAAGLVPGVTGLQIAKVRQTHGDPLGERRVLVTLPLGSDPGQAVWARIASPYASQHAGFDFLPEVDDEVVLAFLDGDPRAPVIVGALHSSARAAPIAPDADKACKAIVSNSQLKLTFDDRDKILTLETPGQHVAVMSDKDKSIQLTCSNGNVVSMSERGIAITSPGDITIDARGSIAITGQAGITLKSPQDIVVQGRNVAAEAALAGSLKGSASAELSSSGETRVQGTMVMIN